MSLSAEDLAAALEHDAGERLRRDREEEAERRRIAQMGPTEKKKDLGASLRKAGNLARMAKLFKSSNDLHKEIVSSSSSSSTPSAQQPSDSKQSAASTPSQWTSAAPVAPPADEGNANILEAVMSVDSVASSPAGSPE
jgi:hypothetical protein